MTSERDPKLHVFEHTCTLHWDAIVFSDDFRSDIDLTFVVCVSLVDHLLLLTGWADNPMEVVANEEVENAFVGAVPSVDGELGEAWARLCGAAFPESAPVGTAQRCLPTRTVLLQRLTVEEVMSQLHVRRAQPTESASA